MPPKKNMQPGQTPSDVKGIIKRIFSYMYGFKIQFALVITGIILSAVAGIAGNALLTPLINNIDEGFKGEWNKTRFIAILAGMGAIYAVGALSTLLFQRMMMKIPLQPLCV